MSPTRILLVRTDKIGDVLLSTPAIKALRDAFPAAYIAMMVRPYAEEIVKGNPYLDEIVIYDKDDRHRSFLKSFLFAMELRKKRFDLAIILHPTNRSHIVTFLAGIPERIGYNRKFGFLLTKKLPHTKQLGQKHEIDYVLDVVRSLGIEAKDKKLFMPVLKEYEERASRLLAQHGLSEEDSFVVLHPDASCPSKRWPKERFAEVGDRLIKEYGVRAVLVSDPQNIGIGEAVDAFMKHEAINLCGKTSVGEFAAILKKAKLFISNDSGPVHMAVAVGTPVIVIFSRSDAGLSPKRWGPTGPHDIVLHKYVGCETCLAHNCKKDFACLNAITVDEVMEAVGKILQ